jgi:superfamily I DNA/RNA helicase
LAGTFHSLALGQLRKNKIFPKILSGKEYILLLQKAHQSIPEAGDIAFDDIVKDIEQISSSITPPSADAFNLSAAIYMQYTQLKNSMNAADFFDLLHLAINGMKDGSIAPLGVKWLLVDEAQDMDEVQYEWIKCHARTGKIEVTMVGDDDQTIYSWRHALGYGGLMQFKKDWDANHITLATNYRSVPSVVNPAAKLISYNQERVKKPIQAFRGDNGKKIEIRTCFDRWEEAQEVAKAILESDVSPEDWAVLARTNMLLDLIEITLRSHEIPCTRYGGKSFWDSPEGSLFLRLVKSLETGDERDTFIALQWAGVPSDIIVHAEEIEGKKILPDGLILTCEKFGKGNDIKSKILELSILWEEWRNAVKHGRERLAIIGVSRWCQGQAEKEISAERFKWCEALFLKMKGSLGQRIALISMPRKRQAEGVSLMTIHASKGLEFPNVWIIGVEEGTLPHTDSPTEEERRLFYVGMTRAEDQLFLSHTIKDARPSRFLQELENG